MAFSSYPGGSVLKTTDMWVKKSMNSLRPEMNFDGQTNPAYEDDSCDSIDSLSLSSETESLELEKFRPRDDSQNNLPSTSSEQPDRWETKPWDVFRVTSGDDVSDWDFQWNACFLFSRTIFCIILLALVICTSIISKMTFLVITSNIFPPLLENKLKTLNGTLSYGNKSSSSTDVRWIWGLILVITAPYIITVLKQSWTLLVKKTWPMKWSTLLMALVIESLESIGLSLFVLVVLPNFDPMSACAISFSICLLPAFLKVLFPQRESKVDDKIPKRIHAARFVNILAFLGQLSSICLWSYYIFLTKSSNSVTLMALVILSSLLISISWWENFVPDSSTSEGKQVQDINENTFTSALLRFKRSMRKQKVRIEIVSHLWKILMTVVIMPSLLLGFTCKDGDACTKTFFYKPSGKAELTGIASTNLTFQLTVKDVCISYFPFIVAIINIVSSFLCYKCVKIASKILAQKISYGFPIVISTPIVIGLLFSKIYSSMLTLEIETCSILPLPTWSHVNTDPSMIFNNLELYWTPIVAGILGFFSFLIVSNHLWSPSKQRLLSTDRIFVRTFYNGAFPDQSLFLNRRRSEKEIKMKEKMHIPIPIDANEDLQGEEGSRLREDDTPMIYMCATMWHESEIEMVQILKSIFRQDYDQCARRHLEIGLGIRDPDYYEFEAHIFFDDAFESRPDINGVYKVNSYVKQLVKCVEIATRSVPGISKTIAPPVRTDTPYGGRLEWKLPGENKLIAHLKDKTKIRHRKRWSQVMYMYYFLAHKLANIPKKSTRQKRTIAENTFLLALDGDVDFQPKAVQLLVDRMRKNPNVGAACGRIHPIGRGPMVWYQKFEYAVSHWLQKAAENILGCVLCSPGCFSLFRGSALMDDNVMALYTKRPTEPHHYVQYDQGEDRWLCTLMLQQGYKVEYVAASDALTYAPEGFYEFYNQRRRWSPSTMANILDLLLDWRNVTKKNGDISKLYILYQMFLMVCSILTPGTIFLMILGAINMAFPAIPTFAAMLVNLFPVLGMLILCFVAKSSTQLAFAAVVSTFYSLLMMIVLVGILVEAVTAGFCSVSTIFLLFVVGVFFVSACLHPQEFHCVLHGFLYFICIPSMSMLLMIYSLGNLHVVSWGTRETKETPPPTSDSTVKTTKNGSSSILESFGFGGSNENSEYLFSCGKFIRCCPVRRHDERPFRIILERLDGIEAQIMKDSVETSPAQEDNEDNVHFSRHTIMIDGAVERNNPLFDEDQQSKHQETASSWMCDDDLKNGTIGSLGNEESIFWNEFIPKYLKPLESDKEHEKQMHHGLLELRNKVCLAFWLMNALYVTIVYVLTEVNASSNQAVSIKLPCTVSEGSQSRGYIEPISFAFTAIFGSVLFIQFVCMLLHRFSTFIHIVAANKFDLKNKVTTSFNSSKNHPTDIGVDDGLKMVKDLQAVKDEDAVSLASEKSSLSENLFENKRREMWKRYTRRLRVQTSQQPQELRAQFVKNLNKLTKTLDRGDDTVVNESTSEKNNEDSDEKVSLVLKAFRNKLDRRTVKAIAENEERTNEIKRRASALNRRKLVKSRWQAMGEKHKLRQAVNDKNPTRTSKVAFVTSAVMAEEKRKRLENNRISVEAAEEEEARNETVKEANETPDTNEETNSSGPLQYITRTDNKEETIEEVEMQKTTAEEATNENEQHETTTVTNF